MSNLNYSNCSNEILIERAKDECINQMSFLLMDLEEYNRAKKGYLSNLKLSDPIEKEISGEIVLEYRLFRTEQEKWEYESIIQFNITRHIENKIALGEKIGTNMSYKINLPDANCPIRLGYGGMVVWFAHPQAV